MQYDITPTYFNYPVVEGSHSFAFAHSEHNRIQGGYWDFYTPVSIMSAPLFNGWHHMAATRDNKTFKFYIDGKLVGGKSLITGGPSSFTTSEYVLGYGMNNGYKLWKGNLDDLRIYRRVMSSLEVNALANQ